MSNQSFSLLELAKIKQQKGEEKSKLSFESYMDNLKTHVNDRSPKIITTIMPPEPNSNEEFVCINEPLEFISVFQSSLDSQDKCKNLFQKMLDDVNPHVVKQVIRAKNNSENIWFNTTSSGINLRPGLKDEEWANPAAITLGDDIVHCLVAGRTGSGKSVFLNSLLFSLMAEYSPWELDLFLADFKKVELSRYLSK